MPVFQYQAVNQEGKTERGLLQGTSLEQAVQSLANKGFQVQEISEAKSSFDPVNGGEAPPTEERPRIQTELIQPLTNPVPLTDIHFFFRQLGTMLKAGIGPSAALDTLAKQAKNAKLSQILLETRDHVIAGRPMSVGLQRYPEVFSPLIVSMVRAGEEGGSLVEQCEQLSEYIQRDIELRNLIRRETAYPKIILGASVFIIFGTNVIISAVRPGAGGIAAPVVLWIIFAAALIGGFLFARVGMRNPAIRAQFDRFTLKVPGVGGMIHGFAMAKFGRAFGALYRSGLPLGRATQLAADACGNEAIRERIYPIIPRMDSGEGIASTWASTGAFSPIVLDMASTGEQTGNMDFMLLKVAEYYEDESTTRSRQAAMVVGVVCFLIVAAYVGYVVVTFWLGYATAVTGGG